MSINIKGSLAGILCILATNALYLRATELTIVTAAKQCDLASINQLISEGADVNAADSKAVTQPCCRQLERVSWKLL